MLRCVGKKEKKEKRVPVRTANVETGDEGVKWQLFAPEKGGNSKKIARFGRKSEGVSFFPFEKKVKKRETRAADGAEKKEGLVSQAVTRTEAQTNRLSVSF